MARKVHRQVEFVFRKWGGERAGAGRKATGKFGREPDGAARAGVAHERRPEVAPTVPLHVTIRTVYNPRNLRHPAVGAAIGKVLKKRARRELGCHVVHFTILRNHLHFIVEAADREALSRGMQGLLSGLARVINRTTGCSGKVWNNRYHARPLASPREVRNCLVYVMHNGQKHGETMAAVDPFSSGAWFDGFAEHGPLRNDQAPVHEAVTWLLRIGWRTRGGGPIRSHETPKGELHGLVERVARRTRS
jgi:REP element-mobilizing transposase RayT